MSDTILEVLPKLSFTPLTPIVAKSGKKQLAVEIYCQQQSVLMELFTQRRLMESFMRFLNPDKSDALKNDHFRVSYSVANRPEFALLAERGHK